MANFATLCLAALLLVSLVVLQAAIYDPLNVFCGPHNCYDILGVSKDAQLKEIKKAYRKLSLTHHPDKSREANATEVFRVITKAYEVLSGNESRPLFDYYLSHPTDYFKVSGQHYYRNMPKSDVRLVIVVVIGLLTWFFYTIQFQKYQRAVKYLKDGTLKKLSLKEGGSKQTLELYRRATDIYMEEIETLKQSGDKSAGKVRMDKDPLFEKIVDRHLPDLHCLHDDFFWQVVAEVKIEGGYRKPEFHDLLAVWLVLSPYYLVQYAIKYHRRYISKAPLSRADQEEMSREKLGLVLWEEHLSEADKEALIAREIWKPEVYAAWLQEQQEEQEKLQLQQAQQQYRASGGKKISKKKLRRQLQQQQDEDLDDVNDYID